MVSEERSNAMAHPNPIPIVRSIRCWSKPPLTWPAPNTERHLQTQGHYSKLSGAAVCKFTASQPINTANSWTLLGPLLMSGGASSSDLRQGAAINTGMNIWPHIHVGPITQRHSGQLAEWNSTLASGTIVQMGLGLARWFGHRANAFRKSGCRPIYLITRFLFRIFRIF